MLTIILDFIGTVFIILGGFVITSKKASNPKIRRLALIFYSISVLVWIPFTILIGAYFMFFSQLIFCYINGKGLYFCAKEIKNKKVN